MSVFNNLLRNTWCYLAKSSNTSKKFYYAANRRSKFLKQEGWLSQTERAPVSAISLRHILASPGYAPGTIVVNVTWMKRAFNACQTHHNMCHVPIYLQPCPSNSTRKFKVRHLSKLKSEKLKFVSQRKITVSVVRSQNVF